MEWISVNDRLPEYEKPVLIYIKQIYSRDKNDEERGIICGKNIVSVGKRALEDRRGNLWEISIWNDS